MGKLLHRRSPRSFLCERTEVKLVDDLALDGAAAPALVAPAMHRRIDELGRGMRSVGLKARRRIGIELAFAIESKSVARTGTDAGDQRGEVPIVLALQCNLAAVIENDGDAATLRRPHP